MRVDIWYYFSLKNMLDNRIRYFISLKSGATYVFPHNYAKIKVDSYDSLPLEKTMTHLVRHLVSF